MPRTKNKASSAEVEAELVKNIICHSWPVIGNMLKILQQIGRYPTRLIQSRVAECWAHEKIGTERHTYRPSPNNA